MKRTLTAIAILFNTFVQVEPTIPQMIQLTSEKLNSENSTLVSTSDSSFEKGNERKNSIALSKQGSYMTLAPTGLTNALGNPLSILLV